MAVSPYSGTTGAFVPTTNVWDVSQIYSLEVTDPAFKELLVRLYQNINNIALVLNIKDSGYYATAEFVNGQLYYPNPSLSSNTPNTPTYRQVLRKVINFGALPNSTTKSVAHGITVTSQTTFTRIYATSSDYNAGTPTNSRYIPIPYVGASSDSVTIYVDPTNVNIVTTTNRTAFTTTYVVLEYLQS